MNVSKKDEKTQKETVIVSIKDKGVESPLGAKAVKREATVQPKMEASENDSSNESEEKDDDQKDKEEDDSEKELEKTKIEK